MLLPAVRYDEGVEVLEAMYESIAAGDPQDPGTLCGPADLGQAARARARLHPEGHRRGRHAARRRHRAPAGLDKGFCVEPTLFVDVDNAMTIAQEEIFGPVLVVIPFEDDDDAVRIANDSVYGLAGGVFSGSLERSLAVARRVRAGIIGVNGGPPTAPTCRSAATRRAASAARTASPGSSSTSRSSRSPGPS